MHIGIDFITFDLPQLYLPIPELAQHRHIEADKLTQGLGLHQMAIPDVSQDVVTFAANAVYRLLKQTQLSPEAIGRIYVGSESGVDSSKPIGSYIISLLESRFGTRSFKHCDTVDHTFACIGGVDALQSCIDFVRLNPTQKAIVVTTDIAKYDLGSSGEYTQGAGALALLISAQPRIVALDNVTGIGTEGVFDFFKPRQTVSKASITGRNDNPEWMGILENEVTLYKEQPVFDGQYSNTCYINRITEAYQHFKELRPQEGIHFEGWAQLFMHLPYCFQARRTFSSIYAQEKHPEISGAEELKAIAKSDAYRTLVAQKIAPSEKASGVMGNLYTGSIFLGLLSGLSQAATQTEELAGQTVGFIAYGSGSKAKVFEGQIQPGWREAIQAVELFQTLEQRKAIDFYTYEKLHKKEITVPVGTPQGFVLEKIEKENPVLVGARYYGFR